MNQLSCNQCREHWDEFINKGSFEAAEQHADVRAHLESCAECRNTFELLVAARQQLHHFPLQEPPASLRSNILREIESSQRTVPWWHSIIASPQRLAWASGAIATVFLVALMMRPDRQMQVMDSPSKVLSNRRQVEEHNKVRPQPGSALQQPKSDASSEKDAPKTLIERTAKTASGTKQQSSERGTAVTKEQRPKSAAPKVESTPKPTTGVSKKMPSPTADSQNSPSPDVAIAPEPEHQNATSQAFDLAPPASKAPDSKVAEPKMGEDTGATKPHRERQRPMNRSMAKGPHGPEGAMGAMQTYRTQNSDVTFRWSTIITSDYDVANAKLVLILGDNLAFAQENTTENQQTLWQGELYRGKKIPLDVELKRVSDAPAQVHLKMINSTTQNILLDKVYEVR